MCQQWGKGLLGEEVNFHLAIELLFESTNYRSGEDDVPDTAESNYENPCSVHGAKVTEMPSKKIEHVKICRSLLSNAYFCRMILTDTHSHLYLDHFKDDFDEVIKRCDEHGVARVFLPNIDLNSVPQMHALVDTDKDRFFPMMGLHPCSVKDDYEAVLDEMESKLRSGEYCAVGEIGIDLYWDKSTLAIQQMAFRRQVAWAKELSLPIVIHARDSFDELFELLDELNDDSLRGIFHCFTGTVEQAQKVLAYGGFMLGIGGVVTFKNSGLDKVVRELPLESLVLETDSPYLAPHPHRGKRNETSYVQIVAQKVADIHETTIERVAEITTANSRTMFGL